MRSPFYLIFFLSVGRAGESTLYAKGRTAHSLFGIPIQENADLHSKIDPFSDRARYLAAADLIVWEELPTANKAAVECVDRLPDCDRLPAPFRR